MKRLYAAAATLDLNTPTDLIRRLNISHQRVKNWEARGISQQGANIAQLAIGVSSTWLLTGSGNEWAREPEPSKYPVTSESRFMGPDPVMLHEALTLLMFDLDHGGPRSARSASDLVLDLYRRIEANGGRLPPDEERQFEEAARIRGQQRGGQDGSDEADRRVRKGRAKR